MESAAVLSATCPSWREIEPTATYTTKSGSFRYRSVTPVLCKSLRRKPDKRDKLATPYTRREFRRKFGGIGDGKIYRSCTVPNEDYNCDVKCYR